MQGPVQEGEISPDVEPYLPGLHGPVQSATGMADVAPYRPAAHDVQDAELAREYLPAGQVQEVGLVDRELQ